MNQIPIDHVLQAVERAASPSNYYVLVLVVAPSSEEKTALLRMVAERLKAPYINASMALGQRLLELPARQRAIRVQRLLDDVIGRDTAAVCLDNLELLFEPSLQTQPLGLLKQLSRKRIVVASWSGRVENGWLIYAEPGHPEYVRESVRDLLIVQPGEKTEVD